MIRHIVLARFRPDLPAPELAALDAAFRSLLARLDGFLAYHGGPDVNFEGLDRGYRHGFVLDFADPAARLRYHEDPEHKALGASLAAAAEGGVEGLLVVDLEVPSV
jgi:Stress responsive A/B Barrel Domain